MSNGCVDCDSAILAGVCEGGVRAAIVVGAGVVLGGGTGLVRAWATTGGGSLVKLVSQVGGGGGGAAASNSRSIWQQSVPESRDGVELSSERTVESE